jgi:hypothetical protein
MRHDGNPFLREVLLVWFKVVEAIRQVVDLSQARKQVGTRAASTLPFIDPQGEKVLRAYPNNRWNPITPLRSCIYF